MVNRQDYIPHYEVLLQDLETNNKPIVKNKVRTNSILPTDKNNTYRTLQQPNLMKKFIIFTLIYT